MIDGMPGGTAATQQVFIEHAGIPTLPALRQAVEALEEMKMFGKVQLIISGGIRTGADVAKALAMGADAVSIGQAALVALGCNSPRCADGGAHRDVTADYERLGTAAGYCHHCHTGQCPVGITTQVPQLETRLDPGEGATRLRNYLNVMNMETGYAGACLRQIRRPSSRARRTSPRLLSRRRRWQRSSWQVRTGYQVSRAAPALTER